MVKLEKFVDKMNKDWKKVKDKSVKGYSIEGYFTQKMSKLSKQDYTDSDILNALAEILKIQ